MKAIEAKRLDHVQSAVKSLTDGNFSNLAAVEVQLDAVASAFLDLKEARSATKGKKPPSLSDVLAKFLEDDDVVDPFAVTLADEITNLIQTRHYESGRRVKLKYVADRLDSLLSDLKNELASAIKKLRAKSGRQENA